MNIEKLSKYLSESAKESSDKVKELGYGDVYDIQASIMLSKLYINEIGHRDDICIFICKGCGFEEFITKSEYDKLDSDSRLYCADCISKKSNSCTGYDGFSHTYVKCKKCGDRVHIRDSGYNEDYKCIKCGSSDVVLQIESTGCMPNPIRDRYVECANCGNNAVVDISEYDPNEKYYCIDCIGKDVE